MGTLGDLKMTKKIYIILFFTLSCLIICICSGCCVTARVEGTIYEKSSIFHEFRDLEENCSSLIINAGSYIGKTEINWTSYHTYQFNGLLKGFDVRILEILIPCDNIDGKKIVLLRESDQKQTKVLPAYLFIKDHKAYAYCDELDTFEDAFKQKYSNHCIILNDDIFQRVDYYIDPDNGSSERVEWLTINKHSDLQWLYRDSESVRLHKLRYFYSVPLDIIVFPLCLLGLIPA